MKIVDITETKKNKIMKEKYLILSFISIIIVWSCGDTSSINKRNIRTESDFQKSLRVFLENKVELDEYQAIIDEMIFEFADLTEQDLLHRTLNMTGEQSVNGSRISYGLHVSSINAKNEKSINATFAGVQYDTIISIDIVKYYENMKKQLEIQLNS